MKNILIALTILLSGLPGMAYQNYMLVSDKPITNVSVSDDEVIKVEDFNINNANDNMIMVIAKNIGTSKLTFRKGKKKINLKVKVKENETVINSVNGIKMISVDLPSELK